MYLSQQGAFLLRRRKKRGPGWHYGAEVGRYIYDFSKETGLATKNSEGFAAGLDVEIVEEVPWHEIPSVYARLEALTVNPGHYHVSQRNCETVANWIISGEAKSTQVTAAAGLGLLALLVVLAQ